MHKGDVEYPHQGCVMHKGDVDQYTLRTCQAIFGSGGTLGTLACHVGNVLGQVTMQAGEKVEEAKS
ncbi:MAG: hypothetical protein ABSC55_02925 [Syntrophorhabdales bacterium]